MAKTISTPQASPHSLYELWNVTPVLTSGDSTSVANYTFTKVSHIKNVKISADSATLLNTWAHQTNQMYYVSASQPVDPHITVHP